MKNEKIIQAMRGLDEKFIREANRDVNAWQKSMEGEAVIADNAKKASLWKIMASAVCTAAALFGVFVLAKNVISLRVPEISASSGRPATENYFGGEGKLKAEDFLIYDDNNIYINLGYTSLKKYNQKTDTLSVVCDTPGCDHSSFNAMCKARMRYCLFNGNLVRIYNKTVPDGNGSFTKQGYLYLRGESEKQVFRNALPEGIDSEHKDTSIGVVYALGDDYLVLYNGGYMHILDTGFNIKHTVIGVGSYSGGVYYVDNEIYYIDDLFRLQKLDRESGESSPVDWGSKKLTEGFVDDNNVLWFSDQNMTLCSYDFKTGKIKEHAEKAVRLTGVGKYVKYMIYGVGDVYLYDIETGEAQKREDISINDDSLFFLDGIYYRYNDIKDELTLYEEDLTTVIKSCALEE